METINEAVAQSAPSLADEITSKIATLEAQIATLTTTLKQNRENIRGLYDAINSDIKENEYDEESNLTYGELNETLESIFGESLAFLKDYEADVEFTVRVVAKYKATDDSEAREIADSIELTLDEGDFSWTHDGDDSLDEIWVDETTVKSVREQ